MRILRITAWVVALATCAIFAGVMLGLPDLPSDDDPWPYVSATVALAPAIVGLLIAIRQPRNVIAWILLVGALSVGAVLRLHPGRGLGAAMRPRSVAAALRVADRARLRVPERPPAHAPLAPVRDRRRGVLPRLPVVALSDPEPFDPPDQAVRSPMAGFDFPDWLEWIWVPLWLGILGSLVAGAVAIRLRLRRSTGVERLQTLWVAWAACLIPLGLVTCFAGWGLGFPYADYALGPILLGAADPALGRRRHRGHPLPALRDRAPGQPHGRLRHADAAARSGVHRHHARGGRRGRPRLDWVTAAGTLVVALSFRPLRARVQGIVDRRFDRARLESLRAVQDFENEVREGLRPPEEIGGVLREALRDPLAELVFWLPESETYATSSGELVAALPDDGRAQSEITREGLRTAVLLHDPHCSSGGSRCATSSPLPRSRSRSRACASRSACSSRRCRPRACASSRRATRSAAGSSAISTTARSSGSSRSASRSAACSARCRSEASILAPALDQIVGEVGSAITDLRQIAAGVRPARLDDGLAAALHDLARTMPIPVEVEAPIGRVSASVEAAAYFVVCEALTNAVKHASASRVALSATRENGALKVSVADDGIGGARARRGSGLAGLDDRISAHGGTLVIASPRGGGTRIEVAIPCDS